jgi:phage baseplate assembly protein W
VSEYFDIRCGDDFDLFGRDAAPLEVLGQDIYHLLITNKGELLQDPDWGFGLPMYLGRPLPPTLAADIVAEVKRDDRVDDATCEITKVAGQEDTYRLVLNVAVADQFLEMALQITPDGIVRVS